MYRLIKRLLRRITKNIVLILANLLQVFVHYFFSIDDKKVFYLPVRFSSFDNAYALLCLWAESGDYRHIYMCENLPREELSSKNVSFISFGLRSIYHYSTAKYVVREAEFNSIGFLSRSGVRYIQLWHAAGAFKKMALDIESRSAFFKKNRKRDIATWDLLLCSSKNLVDIYSNAFNGFDKNKIFVGGLPRNDLLYKMNTERDKVYRLNEINSDQKIVLFAPTFRDKATKRNDQKIYDTINYLVANLPDCYQLAIRLHPSMIGRFYIKNKVINLNNCTVENGSSLFQVGSLKSSLPAMR